VEVLPAKTSNPHLFAAAVVVALTAAILIAGRAIAVHFERSTVEAVAPELFPVKTQGLALQRTAVQARDVLPLYGSSELLGPLGVRAGDFFRRAPTGFQVSPVGKAGATSLIILQKLGALRRELNGKKVGVLLSSVCFVGTTSPYWYEGNFSLFAASKLTFDSVLDFKLKRDIATRMLKFPHTLQKSSILEFALRRIAAGTWFDQLAFCAVWPLGKLENLILDLQDHFAALEYTLHKVEPAPPREPQTLDWTALIEKAKEPAAAQSDEKQGAGRSHRAAIPGSRDERFRASMNESPEWVDLELLLRILTEIHAKPLLISTPMYGRFFEKSGVSPLALKYYHTRIRAVAQRYNFELVDFPEHDEDVDFLNPHLTGKGWIFYDRVLDDFFHERVPQG
jgi:D-alanine transfer protein